MVFLYDTGTTPVGFLYTTASNNDVSAWDAYYFAKNAQGDVLKVYDASMSEVASYTYDAWGKVLTAEVENNDTNNIVNINPIRYRSYYYDTDTALFYLQSRYYDPAIGRFINADVFVSTDITGPLSANMYAYCENNPVNRVDWFGQIPLWIEVEEDCLFESFSQESEADDSLFTSILMYAEHKKKGSTNPSNRNKHEEGQARKNRDKGNEKGDARRTGRSNKRHNILPSEQDYNSKFLAGSLVIVYAIGITYLTLNDATGVGVADDAAIVPLLEMFRRGIVVLTT